MSADNPERDALTPEERARFQELAHSMDEAAIEAEIREILAHPESWTSSEQILRDVATICGQSNETPDET